MTRLLQSVEVISYVHYPIGLGDQCTCRIVLVIDEDNSVPRNAFREFQARLHSIDGCIFVKLSEGMTVLG